jgi:hypothetical protein
MAGRRFAALRLSAYKRFAVRHGRIAGMGPREGRAPALSGTVLAIRPALLNQVGQTFKRDVAPVYGCGSTADSPAKVV